MMKRKGATPIAIGKFGAWLLANMALKDWTYPQCAQAAHCDVVSVCKHVRHKTRPDFRTVVTYCWAFDMKDDPRQIWKLVEEDWG